MIEDFLFPMFDCKTFKPAFEPLFVETNPCPIIEEEKAKGVLYAKDFEDEVFSLKNFMSDVIMRLCGKKSTYKARQIYKKYKNLYKEYPSNKGGGK